MKQETQQQTASTTTSQNANNPHIHLRDKTYVKPPIIPSYLRQRIPVVRKPNAEFRQGYKKY